MKYNLVGIDGNAFSVMGYVINAMRKEKKSLKSINEYQEKAMAGDYNDLLCASMDIVDKLNKEIEDATSGTTIE